MAITIQAAAASAIGVGEFVDYIESSIDLRDLESIAEASGMLARLSADPQVVTHAMNELVDKQYRGDFSSSAQSLYLGRGKGFYVRANIWPSIDDVKSGRLYQENFAYGLAHDHTAAFLTVPHRGPGYRTEIYEVDPRKIVGFRGEPVEMHFLERLTFTGDIAMLYRPSIDMHVQAPPDDLSITLNLMVEESTDFRRDQLYFDIPTRTIAGFVNEQDSSRREAVVAMSGFVGDENTVGILLDIARSNPCRRTRLAAIEARVRLRPEDAEHAWTQAAADQDAWVSRVARERLVLMEK